METQWKRLSHLFSATPLDFWMTMEMQLQMNDEWGQKKKNLQAHLTR